VYSALDLRDEWDCAAKRTALIRQSRGHAFITTLTRVRINGLADLRLLGVFELASLRDRKIIKAGPREFDAEVNCIVNAIAAGDHFIAQKSHAYNVVIADAFTRGAINLQRQ